MKRIILLAAGLTAILLTGSASARASEGPWCALRNFGSDLSEDCQYRTFEECRVTVIAGFRGFCNPNPRWQGEMVNPRLRRKS
jgi:uncharacterized protein DUF3551